MSFFTRATADGGMYLLTCLPRAPFDLNLYCEQVGVGLGINRATRKRLNGLESHPGVPGQDADGCRTAAQMV